MFLDNEDYEELQGKTIYYVKGGYPSFNNNGERVYVHRYIMGATEGVVVDHKNMNILDNRKVNLRKTTHTYNRANALKYNIKKPTSKYKGVTYDKVNSNWVARVKRGNKVFYRGRYSKEDSAALAYNHYAKKAFGEFAYLNNVETHEDYDWTKDKLTKTPSKKQSGYKYITWDSHASRWVGAVTKDGRQIKLRTSESIIDCLEAVNGFILEHELFLLEKYPKQFQEVLKEHEKKMCDEQVGRYVEQLKTFRRKLKGGY